MRSYLERLQMIEDYAIDGSPAKVGSALRACLALGEQVGSVELVQWVTAELEGYRGVEAPDYRQFVLPLKADGQNMAWANTGVVIPMSALPDKVSDKLETLHLKYTVDELAGFIESSDGMIQFGPANMAELMLLIPRLRGFDESFVLTKLYYDVPTSLLKGVIAHVAATLIRLVAEVREHAGADDEIVQKDVVDEATRVVVHGDHAVVLTATGNGSVEATTQETLSSDKSKPVREWLVVIARYAAVAVAAVAAYIGYLEYVRGAP